MMGFPSSRRRTDADARRRRVRPTLESLESRIVPEASGIPSFNQGVAYVTQTLAHVPSDPLSHILTDLNLDAQAAAEVVGHYSNIATNNSYMQLTNKAIGGLVLPGEASIASWQQNINLEVEGLAYDYGIHLAAQADLQANLTGPALQIELFFDALAMGTNATPLLRPSPSPNATPVHPSGGFGGYGGGGFGGQ